MINDPYSIIVEIMERQGRKYNSPSIKIATVIYVEEKNNKITDIKIKVNDLVVDKDNIYISDYLLKGHRRELNFDTMLRIPEPEPKRNTILEGSKIDDTQWVEGKTREVPFINHLHEIEELKIKHSRVYTVDSINEGDLVAVMPVEGKQIYIILSRLVQL